MGNSDTLSKKPRLILRTTTSISMAVLSSCARPKALVKPMPITVRPIINPSRVTRSVVGVSAILSRPAPTEPAAIIAIPSSEPRTQIVEKRCAYCGKRRRNAIPSNSGNSRQRPISMAILRVGMAKLAGIYSAIKKSNINGVVTRQATEVSAVMLMDRGTLPRAIKVKIFDEVPPGMAAIMAIPIIIPEGRSVKTIKPKATRGTITSCISRPTFTAFGCSTTF